MRVDLKMAFISARKTQREVAQNLGMAEVLISKFVCGVADPTEDQMKAIAQELGKSVRELFPETDPERAVA